MIELILGGARSGKSRFAEQRATHAATSGARVIYVATGEAKDDEMAARIAHHRQRRPAAWATVDSPLYLADTLRQTAAPDTCLLVDCLTLWLTNLLLEGARDDGKTIDGTLFEQQRALLLSTLPTLPGHIVLVSNEVGCGIVPLGALSRRFVDEQGRLNQDIAAGADQVTLVAAGLPLCLKA